MYKPVNINQITITHAAGVRRQVLREIGKEFSVHKETSLCKLIMSFILGLQGLQSERAEPLKGATPPKGGLATLPTTPPPLVGGSAREVSDLAVSLNVVGVEVGGHW